MAGPALVLSLAGCGTGSAHQATPTTATSVGGTTAVTTTTQPPPPTTPPLTTVVTTSTPVPPAPPQFTATATAITAADVPHTWRPGCPVAPAQLRMLHLIYWGFDGQAHTGTMVVNASVVNAVEAVFRTLYLARFPIHEMIPEDAYGGNDLVAAAANDTSGFNCRDVIGTGPPRWSVHAFGEAIDVNDVQNPYIEGGTVIPAAGAAYINRADVRPGMAVAGGTLVEAFASVGWQWGGRWTASPDYQHFSATGG